MGACEQNCSVLAPVKASPSQLLPACEPLKSTAHKPQNPRTMPPRISRETGGEGKCQDEKPHACTAPLPSPKRSCVGSSTWLEFTPILASCEQIKMNKLTVVSAWISLLTPFLYSLLFSFGKHFSICFCSLAPLEVRHGQDDSPWTHRGNKAGRWRVYLFAVLG